jgi:octaprenyl-diphosphate synthase
MSIQQIRELVADDLDQVNTFIHQQLKMELGLIHDMSSHLLNAGGKQLRPLIALLSCRALGYQGDLRLNLAAMLEFFHSATLLHDDVIDESKLRRGQDTAHQIWGNKAAVLVGDYLFSLHTKLLVAMNNLEIISFMAETSRKIGQGEIQQLVNRFDINMNENQYFSVIEAKTSLLFAAGAKISGLLAQNQTTNFYDYGLHLGNSFQLTDDILDYNSNAKIMGKNQGDDLADGKLTLPLIYTFKHAETHERELIKASLESGSSQNFEAILQIVEKTGG